MGWNLVNNPSTDGCFINYKTGYTAGSENLLPGFRIHRDIIKAKTSYEWVWYMFFPEIGPQLFTLAWPNRHQKCCFLWKLLSASVCQDFIMWYLFRNTTEYKSAAELIYLCRNVLKTLFWFYSLYGNMAKLSQEHFRSLYT